MEKILLAINAENPHPHSLDFACYVASLTRSSLTGVFLENLVVNESFVLRESNMPGQPEWEIDRNSKSYLQRQETVRRNIDLFRSSCEKRSVRHTVHNNYGDPSADLIRESRFADLIVLDAETTFHKTFEGAPTDFAKEVLKDAECPVIIAPESFDSIDEIIFTYNGSKSSMFAIKQFCHLFPSLDDKRITVLQITDGEETAIDKQRMKEWISKHYSSIGYEMVKGDTEAELLAHLIQKQNALIVMGAYGRSAVSQFFKRSHADVLIKTITQAIFIAHC